MPQIQLTNKRRKCITLVALICDHAEIQRLLPQVLIANHHTFLKRELDALARECTPNMILVRHAVITACLNAYKCLCRQKSGWSNADLTASIVRRLALTLRPYTTRFQVVLLMDALRAHLATVVLDAMTDTNVLPLIIPAGLTDTLQPLDTHAFSAFKNALREKFEQARCSADRGDVSMPRFVACIKDALATVLLGRDWGHAFAHNGFELYQRGVSVELETSMHTCAAHRVVNNAAPTLSQIELCLPRSAHVAAAIMWRRFLQPPQAAALLSPVIAADAPLPSGRVAPVFGRTRSQTRALRTDAAT